MSKKEREEQFSHLSPEGEPSMVGVGKKQITYRTAIAESFIEMEEEVLLKLEGDSFQSPKGPVFQTAILAGTMGVKKTADLIPLCHPLAIEKINIEIAINPKRQIHILCEVSLHGKTGVEMEALTGASVAALTIYDMCKALSHNIIIKETRLVKKTGGKKDFQREAKA